MQTLQRKLTLSIKYMDKFGLIREFEQNEPNSYIL
jgi:hypothetical protein